MGGTSLQMIADAVGVTKAAVYHQFKTKDEIVIAAAETELAGVAAGSGGGGRARPPAGATCWSTASSTSRSSAALDLESTLLGDPVIIRVFARHERFRQVMDHLYRLLAGTRRIRRMRASAAMLTAAIGGAVMHPLVADLDDETLRSQLRRLARRFLDLPDDGR